MRVPVAVWQVRLRTAIAVYYYAYFFPVLVVLQVFDFLLGTTTCAFLQLDSQVLALLRRHDDAYGHGQSATVMQSRDSTHHRETTERC